MDRKRTDLCTLCRGTSCFLFRPCGGPAPSPCLLVPSCWVSNGGCLQDAVCLMAGGVPSCSCPQGCIGDGVTSCTGKQRRWLVSCLDAPTARACILQCVYA